MTDSKPEPRSIVQLDARGRVLLNKVAEPKSYFEMKKDHRGVITLTPLTVDRITGHGGE